MTPLRYILAFAMLLGLTAAASASPLDTPTLAAVGSDRTSITLEVDAGASGAPAGFTIQWMTLADYQRLGGWPGDPTTVPGSDFTGVPTLTVTPGVASFRLGPGEAVNVALGALFDETGVSTNDRDELTEGTTYVVRAWAAGGAGYDASPPTPTCTAGTQTPGPYDCTLSQGFWKSHPEAWATLTTLKLGTVAYNQTQCLAILGQQANGNGLVSLAHQLIAAKLNLLLGATPPAAISTAIGQADALIGALVVPPVGAGFLAPSATDALTATLDAFNTGSLGPGHCPNTGGIVPTRASTWGALKAHYR